MLLAPNIFFCAKKIFARILRIRKRTPVDHIELEAGEVNQAKMSLIKFCQKGMIKELKQGAEKGTGRYRKLAPSVDKEGVWRVGSRLKNYVPFTLDRKLPALLPPEHRITSHHGTISQK